jgi:hypothetical protein
MTGCFKGNRMAPTLDWQERTLPIVRVLHGGQVLAQSILLALLSKTVPSAPD